MQDIVTQYLEQLRDNDIYVLLDDCNYQDKFNLYGNPTIDKPNWLKYRKLIEAEYKKRGINYGNGV